nr:protein kinase [Kofleriaceae bacterium]
MAQPDDDAFAETVAPASSQPTAPPRDAPAGRALAEVPYASFTVGREIARGGMGKIVAAADARLAREVALKVLLEPAGDQLERFQREALITARLQHPGIVPVYEAGRWPSGEPFFAMKLVEGKPLDQVIAAATTLEARLALLPRVVAAADAIAYAHSQRIVHRDLKPANVLIGDFGETVVIDWGLAKDLDSADASVERSGSAGPRGAADARRGEAIDRIPRKTSASATDMPAAKRAPGATGGSTLTVAGAVMGTPAYMAPEQARGEPVDERADVFALGAMLYHLLAGTPPYRARTATDVIAAAALGRVVPLGETARRAPPDLVAIVHRAMAQEPPDRYPDAGAVAVELRRFLTGQLVGAHRYTAWQRVARFVRKHRAAVGVAAIATATLAVGGTLALRDVLASRDRADRERDIAVIRGQAAEQLVDDSFKDTETELRKIGRLDVLEHLGDSLDAYFTRLEAVPGGLERADVARMAEAIELIGQAQQKSGKPDAALASWMAARDRLEVVIAARDPSEPVADQRRRRRLLAQLAFEIATNYQQRGRVPEAMRELDVSKKIYAALRVEDPSDVDALLGDAVARDRLGDLLRNAGKVDDAFAEYLAAKADREAAVAAGGGSASGDASAAKRALATSHMALGSATYARGDSAGARAEYEAALALRRELAAAEPANLELQHELLDGEDALGDLQRQIGDDAGAIATYQAARPVVASLIARDRDNQVWRRQQGMIEADLGFVQLDRGDYAAGLASLGRAIELQRAAKDADPKSTIWAVDLARSLTRAGDGHFYAGQLDDAIAAYAESAELRAALVARDGKSVPFRRGLGYSHAKLAVAYAAKGDAARALAEDEAAFALRAQLVDEAPAQRGYKDELALSACDLGRALLAGDAAAQARGRGLIERGVQIASDDAARDPLNIDWQTTLVVALVADADAARVGGDRAARAAALDKALAVATAASRLASQNAHLPGYVADIEAQRAELAATPADARAAWQAARDALAPLAASGRLPAWRKPLLDRAAAR